MNRSLEDHMLRAIVVRWHQGERAVSSESVYNTLIAAGVMVPPRAMNVIFQSYCGLGLGCTALVGTEAIPQHGQRMVTDMGSEHFSRDCWRMNTERVKLGITRVSVVGSDSQR